jgi:hypothetical protein
MTNIEGMADELFAALEAHIERRVGPLRAEIVELRMAVAEATGRIEAIKSGPLTSVERRLSRHAEHLAALESRTKAIERA